MMEVALAQNGREITHIAGYKRVFAPLTALSGGVLIFPKLGTAGQYHKIDQVVVFHTPGSSHQFAIYNIQPSPYQHSGGKDLRIIFRSRSTVSATPRTAQDVADMKKWREFLDSTSDPDAESV